MRKRIAIILALLAFAGIVGVIASSHRRTAPLRVAFLGYTNAHAGSGMGFFGTTKPIEVPAGLRVGLFGVTNVTSGTVARWSTCAVELRGSGSTNVWLDSFSSLGPGKGECLRVPLPTAAGGWRVMLRSSHGWKNRWNDLLIHLRFLPSGLAAQPDQVFSD